MPTSIKLDDVLTKRIQALAAARQRSAHWLMREAITQFVDREEARESFRKEAMDSWTSFQETGLHLTGEEVQDWLSTWGARTPSTVPTCHE